MTIPEFQDTVRHALSKLGEKYDVYFHYELKKTRLKVVVHLPFKAKAIDAYMQDKRVRLADMVEEFDCLFFFRLKKISLELSDSHLMNDDEQFYKFCLSSLQPHIVRALKEVNQAQKLVEAQVPLLSESKQQLFTNWLVHYSNRSVRTLLQPLRTRLTGFLNEEKLSSAVSELTVHYPELFQYASLFQIARKLKRKITFYAGPTNSGKTYQALNMLSEGKTGVYLAPLRLLALEGQDELTKRGVVASFITGEERSLIEGATHVSATIEMLDVTRQVDSVLIDEIQMIEDPMRGWAWTQALIGAPSEQVILCGSANAIPAVKKIARYLNEEVEIVKLERFNPLKFHSHRGTIDAIPEKSAVIAFSRKDVLALKEAYEAARIPVSVIYGNLSPQVRREQAHFFRTGQSKVLVSTDAIAMGLNLPISQVYFSTLEKFDGRDFRYLSHSEILQIAGRAGRKGYDQVGYVSMLAGDKQENLFLKDVLAHQKPEELSDIVWIKPSIEHIHALGKILRTHDLRTILSFFIKNMRFDEDWFKPADLEDMLTLSKVVDRLQMALEDKFTFSVAPVSTKSVGCFRTFVHYAESFAKQRAVGLKPFFEINIDTVRTERDLRDAEDASKTLTLYSWLSFRYPELFPEQQESIVERERIDHVISAVLKQKRSLKKTRKYSR